MTSSRSRSSAAAGAAAAAERDRLRLLLDASSLFVSTLDMAELLGRVATWLKKTVPHDVAALILPDEAAGALRIHALDGNPARRFVEFDGLIPFEGTPAGRAIATRRRIHVDRLDPSDFTAPIVATMVDAGMRSICTLPLVTRDRVLGVLSVVSSEEAAFSVADADLLEAVAAHLAVAVENALSFREIGDLKGRLAEDRERLRLLLDITNALVSTLDLPELLHQVSSCLQGVVAHDFAGLAIWDEASQRLLVHALDVDPRQAPVLPNVPLPLDGTPAGLAFTSRRTVFRERFDPEEFHAPEARRAHQLGIRSGCAVPLLVRDRALGVIAVASFREAALTPADVSLLEAIAQQVAIAVENAVSYREIADLKNRLAREKLYLEEEIRTEHNFAEIVGRSPALRRVLEQIETVAPTDSVVLVVGETGTGKELVARAIHDLSERRERTLVKLNCAAIPTGLLESELFGHERGAFTGAIAQRIGRFELAHRGTLLLDEVGDIPLDLQPKLLRVLQEHEFERLGSSRTIRVDARLIAATNADLPEMVAEKRFRSDLFYRLNVFPIAVPPLRERVEDVPLLTAYFAQMHGRRMRKEIRSVPRETVEAMCEYAWPGNVRELENFVERAVILTRGEELQAPLGELRRGATVPVAAAAAVGKTAPATLEQAERAHIEEVLRRTNGVVGGRGGAAEILGLPISTLRGRMKKLGLL